MIDGCQGKQDRGPTEEDQRFCVYHFSYCKTFDPIPIMTLFATCYCASSRTLHPVNCENGGNVLFDMLFMCCLVLFASIKLLKKKNYVLCTSCEKATTECSQTSESHEHEVHIRRGPDLPPFPCLASASLSRQ